MQNCGPCHPLILERLRGEDSIFVWTVCIKIECSCGKYVENLSTRWVQLFAFIEGTVYFYIYSDRKECVMFLCVRIVIVSVRCLGYVYFLVVPTKIWCLDYVMTDDRLSYAVVCAGCVVCSFWLEGQSNEVSRAWHSMLEILDYKWEYCLGA